MTMFLKLWTRFWALTTVVMCAPLIYMALDYSSPIVIHDYKIPPARLGDFATVMVMVDQDLSRKCDIEIQTDMLRSDGVYVYNVNHMAASAGVIEAREKAFPGLFSMRIFIPKITSPGKTQFVNDVKFRCANNFWQKYFVPIRMTITQDFEVLP